MASAAIHALSLTQTHTHVYARAHTHAHTLSLKFTHTHTVVAWNETAFVIDGRFPPAALVLQPGQVTKQVLFGQFNHTVSLTHSLAHSLTHVHTCQHKHPPALERRSDRLLQMTAHPPFDWVHTHTFAQDRKKNRSANTTKMGNSSPPPSSPPHIAAILTLWAV